MGVVVDLSAVKAVNDAKRRKIKRNTPREQNESAVRPSAVRIVDEDVDSKGTHAEIRGRAADQRAMMELRSQEISDLGSATGGFGDDAEIPIIVDSDAILIEEFKNEQLRTFRREQIGQTISPEDLKKEISSLQLQRSNRSKAIVEIQKATQTVTNEDGPGEVIYRDEDGFRITRARWLELQATKKGGYKIKKREKEKKVEREPVAWGKGMHQEQERKRKEEEEERIASEPLTRHDIDSTLDHTLKNTVRWDDPLRHVVSKELTSWSSRLRDRNSSSSDVKERLKCRFATPPNRFGIQSGYRWDGVIRGNGYEGRYLQERNKKKFEQQASYKWSVEDL